MRKILHVLMLVAALVTIPFSAQAQQTTGRTALGAALSQNGTNVTLLSTTGITAPTNNVFQYLYIDNEQMRVTAINSATSVTVQRGGEGMPGQQTAHLSGATVWTGPSTVFVTGQQYGACTRSAQLFLPKIDARAGILWDCILSPPQGTPTAVASTQSVWIGVSMLPYSTTKPYKKLAVSAVAYTLLPTDHILGINTNVSVTITIGAYTGLAGKEYFIQNEISGPQTVVLAASTGQTINGAASITFGGSGAITSYGGVYLYGDGVNWFARRGDGR